MPPQTSNLLLHSNRLAVEIAGPGTAYRGTRFDWSGFVTQVTLDGSHTFCVPESYQPGQGTGGIGLCNEYTGDEAIGYAEAGPGDPFTKLGIGLLKRPDAGPYNVFKPLEIMQLFPVTIDSAPDQARFGVAPVGCRGYAAREEKILSVQENQLTITTTLENTGVKPIHIQEFVHNFIGIDRHLIGPDYRLSFPYPLTIDPATRYMPEPEVIKVDGHSFTFAGTPQQPFYCRPQGAVQTGQPQWELTYAAGKIGMREFDDFAPHHVAVWGVSHVISAEIFVPITLAPGEKQSWSRRFEFFG